MKYTNEQRIFCLETYVRSKSYRDVQVQFQRRFGQCNFPSKTMLVKLVKKFRDHGIVHNLNRKGVGPPHSGRGPQGPKQISILSELQLGEVHRNPFEEENNSLNEPVNHWGVLFYQIFTYIRTRYKWNKHLQTMTKQNVWNCGNDSAMQSKRIQTSWMMFGSLTRPTFLAVRTCEQ